MSKVDESNLLLEIDYENDEKGWEKNIEENENDADEMFYGVRDSFDRLAVDLGGDFVMGCTAEYIKKFLNYRIGNIYLRIL